MTQADLGDATGLSVVHINRTIRQLREDGLIRMNKGRLTRLPDWQRLTEAAEFNPAYLRVANVRSLRKSTCAHAFSGVESRALRHPSEQM